MDAIVSGLFENLFRNTPFESIYDQSSYISESFLRNIISLFKNYQELFSYYLTHTSYYHMQYNTTRLVRTILLPKLQQYMDISEADLFYYYSFISQGFIVVITHWMNMDCQESEEKLAQLILHIMPARRSGGSQGGQVP